MGKSRHLASGFGAVGRFLRPSPAPSLVPLLQSFLSLDSIEPASQHFVKNEKWLRDKEEGGGRVHKKKEASLKIFAIASGVNTPMRPFTS